MWLACVISHLCHEHNSSVFWVLVSSTTFAHKSYICSTIDSCRLFLHRVNSNHYLYHRQNMDLGIHRPEAENKSVKNQNKIVLFSKHCNQARWRIHFASQWQVLKDPRDHARDRKQRRLHLALIFECTFHRLIVFLNCFA